MFSSSLTPFSLIFRGLWDLFNCSRIITLRQPHTSQVSPCNETNKTEHSTRDQPCRLLIQTERKRFKLFSLVHSQGHPPAVELDCGRLKANSGWTHSTTSGSIITEKKIKKTSLLGNLLHGLKVISCCFFMSFLTLSSQWYLYAFPKNDDEYIHIFNLFWFPYLSGNQKQHSR